MMMIIYIMFFGIFQIAKSVKQSSANDKHFTVTVNMPKILPILGYVLQHNYDPLNNADWTRFKERINGKQRKLYNKMEEVLSKNKAIEAKVLNTFKSLERRMQTIEKETFKIHQLQKTSHNTTKVIANVASSLNEVKLTINDLQVRIAEEYVGCFQDNPSDRHFRQRIQSFGNKITLALCKRHCKGYKFTGLQGGKFCLCGNDVNSEKIYHQRLPESRCSLKCEGEPTRNCGHHGINSIYRV
ncbi:Hypothetical predicted protein [Mytilus galloprovincialis]|uniref:WSC domain-containing protein n=1 Tax=Mytilus galloprovincialis TaxID=29158 RepID=A0A8B6EMC1_MYTGA|nr:Hypothetical predicted protein [Mytilus galloprovincialis]